MESLVKGPRASRSVDGAFDDPSGYGNRGCRHPESTCPEPTRLLHVKLLSRGQHRTTLSARKYKTVGILILPAATCHRRHDAELAGPELASGRRYLKEIQASCTP
jgi:hypothetical protein